MQLPWRASVSSLLRRTAAPTVFDEGGKARRLNYGLKANPYRVEPFMTAWAEGWTEQHRRIEMEAFDSLPESIRQALGEQKGGWILATTIRQYLTAGASADRLIAAIQQNDNAYIERTTVLK